MSNKIVLALAGNQNSGKTTLFNRLTGSNRHVGNFPGVTVERWEGHVSGHEFASVVDLPGIYSLSPYSAEEMITRSFLTEGGVDAIIDVVDATNMERNLYLSLQLIELGLPMVIALNMMDEMRANGNTVDVAAMSDALGVPIVPISAGKNEGIHELVDAAIDVAVAKQRPQHHLDFCSGPAHRCIHSIAHMIEDHAERLGISERFAATKLIEGDAPLTESLGLNENELESVEHLVKEMENELGTDREAALADTRYNFIEGLVARTVVKRPRSRERERSAGADVILTHKFFAIPIFFGIMGLIFWLTFGVVGQPLSDALGTLIDSLSGWVGDGLDAVGINPFMRRFIVDGVLTGVGTVVSFVPVIAVMFFLLSLLEDSGYMARIAFVMDRPLRCVGLSGRSVVPMLLGFGCSVPAVMSTRTLPSERDRKLSILLIPFMSCSAKLPVYALFTAVFFPKHGAAVMSLLYILGVLGGFAAALVLRNIPYFRGSPVPFVLEMPNYRLPNLRSVLILLWEKCRDFLSRAFTVIFVATVAIWLLSNLNVRLYAAASYEDSMLADVSRLVAPLFAPLGFGFWQAAIAVIVGLMAKEATISTLAVVTNAGVGSANIAALFTPAGAFAFLVFTLLYTPCIAAMATIRRELRSGDGAALAVAAGQFAIAWCAAFAAYHLWI
ncbi:MAG: ferrous iron transport protein B [Synergistaceae bacterium]|jgi:ferrous iron transport protein B|nr:ferrous iron transport protein B [Synergistaceae bacterium]